MRRNILSAAARPSRALAGLNLYPRRTFTSTIAAQEQAHPIGPFYEAILRSPPFIPETKPEAAPLSSAPEVVAELPQRPKPTPTAPAPAAEQPKPEPTKAEQPAPPPPPKEETVPESTPSKPAAAPKSKKAPAAPKEAEPVKETPAKRTRASSKKAKSVAPDFSSSPPSSSLSSPYPSLSSSAVLPSSFSTTSREQTKPSEPRSNDPSQASSRERESNSNPQSDTPESRARVIFSSSLVGPAERAERLAAIKSQSRLVAGVLVPPKPEEPDNCCMSGCVNCVWDRYRDELEGWASASAEAERRLMAREASSSSEIEEEGLLEGGRSAIESVDASMAAADQEEAIPAVGSMDDDGGGSETNWIPPTTTTVGKKKEGKEFWNEELYKNVPVGIREFMKHEKRLKEKHLREGTLGG